MPKAPEAVPEASQGAQVGWLIKQLVAFEQDDEHKPIAKQLRQFEEKDGETDTLHTKQNRLNRLGDRRKHVEKQVQKDTAAIEDLLRSSQNTGRAWPTAGGASRR